MLFGIRWNSFKHDFSFQEEMEKHQFESSPFGGKSDRFASEAQERKVSFADFRRQKARDQVYLFIF